MKYLLVVFMVVFSSFANAEYLDCGEVTIEKLYVQGPREDGYRHQNSALIYLGSDKSQECENVQFAQIKNSEQAYSGILSMALAAYASKTKIRVVVNATGAGTTYQIEWVNFN